LCVVIPSIPLSPKIKYTEEELIAAIRQKDQKAFSYLYDNYSKALYGIIYNILQKEEDAQDVLQGAFLKIWNNFAAYSEAKGRLFTWMLNIVRNAAIDFTRTAAAKSSSKIQSIESNVYEVNRQHQQEISYDHIGLRAAVDGLGEDHQAIIDLAYYQGYTQEEIAHKLGMPLGTVKTKVRQAIMKLRDKIVS
jgi:RNA polymerase sigma-70 factor, ECF subfamily